MFEHLGKNIPEFSYLTANQATKRYRCIMRFFYEQYQKMNYWLRPAEIVQGVLSYGIIEEYEPEECQRDLNALVGWKNLTEQHDGTRVTTIEDYLKKRYRYMMTPYAIEIERLVQQLENITGYGGSLQPSKLHELVRYIRKIRWWSESLTPNDAEEVWDNLTSIFKDLNEQAADYIASLNSKKSEELYSTEAFLLYKDSVVGYLQNFIQVLQSTAPGIEQHLNAAKLDPLSTARFLQQVASAKHAIPNLEDTWTADEWQASIEDQWSIIERWFVKDEYGTSNVRTLESMTKDTIYKLVRYAVRIQEQGRHGISRRQELEIIGNWFFSLEALDDAHRLAAYAFGLYETRHYHGVHEDRTFLADTSIWQTTPQEKELPPRGHQHKERSQTAQPVVKRRSEPASIQEYVKKRQQEEGLIEKYLRLGYVRMDDLTEEISAVERQQLLLWIGRCLANQNKQFRTPDGVRIALLCIPDPENRATLRCEDGDLDVPNYTLVLRKGDPS